jgi:hypothetical protein
MLTYFFSSIRKMSNVWDSSDEEVEEQGVDVNDDLDQDDSSQSSAGNVVVEENNGMFCNTTLPQLLSADFLELEHHRNRTSDDESSDDGCLYRSRATADLDSILLMGTAQVFNNVVDSAGPDGSVFNFSSTIKRTKTESGGRTTMFFDRAFPVPTISGK